MTQLLLAMEAAGCKPESAADIQATDKTIYYRIAGDKPSKKSGGCSIKIVDEDFAIGWFTNYRTGDMHKWHSKSSKKLTAEEKASRAAKIEADNKVREDIRAAEAEAAAKEAAEVWSKALPCISHDYLTRKRIQPHGLKIYQDNLIIPLRNADSQIRAYQEISPDGLKLYRGPKTGHYSSIVATGSPLDIICISTGFATCASIHEACGLPVVVALDDGNLKSVAQAIRKKYPKAKIIICSDSDQWTFITNKKPVGVIPSEIPGDDERWKAWRNEGRLINSGRTKGQQAALAVKGFSVWPDIPDNDADKRTDFNDVSVTEGPESVRVRIMPLAEAKEPPLEPEPVYDVATMDTQEQPPDHVYEAMMREIPLDYATEYDPAPKANREAMQTSPIFTYEKLMSQMIIKAVDKNGVVKIETNSGHNILTYLRHHEALNGVFRLDVFAGQIILHRCPPWEADKEFKARILDDVDITHLSNWLERSAKMMPRLATVRAAIYAVAKECYIDPPLDYFKNIKWDQTARLHQLFSKYFGACEQPTALLEAIGKMWLVGGVARQFRPGCKLDNIVVLEGLGGAKKSTALETLATIKGERYFSDALDFKDIRSSNSIQISKGKIILEFQELNGLDENGIDGIIKWLSIKTDECRVPYATHPQKFDRRFILAGTTNETVYLPAHGGIRRFWNIKCGDQIDCKSLAEDCEQLWAEAAALYLSGYKWWIEHDDPIRRLVENEQAIRINERTLMHPVLDYLAAENPHTITASKIITGLNITNAQRTMDTTKQVNAILKEAGWKKTTARVGENKQPAMAWMNPKFRERPQQAEFKVVEQKEEDDSEAIKWG